MSSAIRFTAAEVSKKSFPFAKSCVKICVKITVGLISKFIKNERVTYIE